MSRQGVDDPQQDQPPVLWIRRSMRRSSTGRPVVGGADAAEAGTLKPPKRGQEVGLALYLVGAERGGRFLMPSAGEMTIGRGRDCQVVVEDPLASRRHARLHIGESLVIEDLGSANGTTLGKERLVPGERKPVAIGEPFLIGSLAFVVRSSGLPYLSPQRIMTTSAFLARIARATKAYGLARIKIERTLEPRWLEAILAGAMAGDDLLIPIQSGEAAVFRAGATAEELDRLMHACVSQLASWEVAATGESLRFDPHTNAGGLDAVHDFLRGNRILEIRRGGIVLSDPAMVDVHRIVRRVARTAVNVLILGETGVGKDVIASLLHELSPRKDHPFLKLNCATFSESLLESELFGHEKGAFTGAVAVKAGLLENADGGTVFLDELGEMPLEVQAKLLRVIEGKEVMRIGGVKSKPIDVRFVAATNRDLEERAARGAFRSDLFYRLDTVQIRVPPLRERPSEILPLAERFLAQASGQFGLGPLSFSPAAVAAIQAYAWPGNVRQLRNAVERAALLGNDTVLEPIDLDLPKVNRSAVAPGRTPTVKNVQDLIATSPDAAAGRPLPALPDLAGAPSSWAAARQAEEQQRIVEALQKCGGNQSRAAELLGMPRRTLVRKLGQYGLTRSRRSPQGAADDE
jgi:two-component system, NtrC family, response regulator AtoC